jgi:predicted DCC family thiol-disulfide oxidoreductase YuxK
MSSIVGRVRARSHRVRATGETTAILVYDGECGFCARCARWIELRTQGVDVVPWQSLDLAGVGLTEQQVRDSAYWLEGPSAHAAEGAVARSLQRCGGTYAVIGRALLFPGVRPLAARAYRFVARHRNWFSALLPRR